MQNSQKRDLKKKAHQLKPVILMGSKGLTEAVNNEIDRALEDHELIKIRIQANDREERNQIVEMICQTHGATLIQSIGHIIAIYRKRPEKDE